MNLNELAAEIHGISKAKGFWPDDQPRNPAEVLMLIVTEVAEAMEAIRDGMPLNEPHTSWHSGPNMQSHSLEQITFSNTGWRRLDGVPVEMIPDVWRSLGYIGKPEGVPSEMADIIIRVLDACAAWGIDIDTAIREKIEYNATRDHLHGRTR
jgi:NTP pyrophosphatase (non-canonical NTP hydrolase)